MYSSCLEVMIIVNQDADTLDPELNFLAQRVSMSAITIKSTHQKQFSGQYGLEPEAKVSVSKLNELHDAKEEKDILITTNRLLVMHLKLSGRIK